jgi:hypothetical protein
VMLKFMFVFTMFILLPTVCVAAQSQRNNYAEVDQYIESLSVDIPKDLIRAIAWVESGWRQFDNAGGVYVDGSMSKITHKISKDYGIMQINEKTIVDSRISSRQVHKLKSSMEFNILFGISVFEEKIHYVRFLKKLKKGPRIWKRYGLSGLSERQIVILAYNGIQADHLYLDLVEQAMENRPWETLPGVKRRGVRKVVP